MLSASCVGSTLHVLYHTYGLFLSFPVKNFLLIFHSFNGRESVFWMTSILLDKKGTFLSFSITLRENNKIAR